MKKSVLLLSSAMALAGASVQADIIEKHYRAQAAGTLTITLSGACSAKLVYGPESPQYLSYD